MDDYYNVVFSDHKLNIPGPRLYSTLTKADVENAAEVFLEMMMSMIVTMSVASAVIFVVVMYLMMKMMLDKASFNIVLYFVINNALVGRIKKMVPAQVLKNRE